MSAPPKSLLDPGQVLQGAFIDATGELRVKTNLAVSMDGSNEILITDEHDSIKIGDGSGVYLDINPDGSINANVTGTVTATNPSVGITGTTAPTSATEIGGINPSGNLQALKVDANGSLLTYNDNSFSTISPGYPTQKAVGLTSVELFAANPNRKYAHISNNSGNPIYIQYGATAALNQGIKISQGGFFTLEVTNLWRGSINGIGLVASQLIDLLEGQ